MHNVKALPKNNEFFALNFLRANYTTDKTICKDNHVQLKYATINSLILLGHNLCRMVLQYFYMCSIFAIHNYFEHFLRVSITHGMVIVLMIQ